MALLLILCLLQGSSLAPSHRGPHLRWLQGDSLPSGTHLCAMEVFTSSSPLCWPEESSFAVASTLKGPKLVSGKPGGAVTIQCHYIPLSANRHQRKYWCRLEVPTRICHTIVSSNHYTHRDYQGRVTLADFPQSSLFVVRLSQLSLRDVGQYRCGIGDRNNRLFLSMNLTISVGPSKVIPTATLAASELVTVSFGTGSPASNRWTSGAIQTLEGQGTKWDRVPLTSGTSQSTATAKGRQTPATTWAETPETGSGTEGSIKATVPTPESPASKLSRLSSTTESVREGSIHNLVTNTARASKGWGEMTTEAHRAGQETDRARTDPDAARRTRGTTRPSAPVSEQLAQETLREATPVSKQPAPGSTEEATPTTGVWTLSTTSMDTASVEGSTYGDLDSTVGGRGPQATPSQAPGTGPRKPSGMESSVKSGFPEEISSQILTPVCAVLAPFLIVALILLQRRLRKNRPSQEAERAAPRVTLIQMTHFLEPTLSPAQLPHEERKMLQGDSPTQAGPTAPERDPGLSGMER
ncbi:high affinity immunoglobulin alpha and immunoglobulin mu Fc receptor [Sciurus carolinensis]|uniref:high affinity immunoglobulin alpha and immunoglobulin mu Fc receptor n=1 Tax=Sciurus carolinensis TaxID=30640 RepID=UPI001FB1AFA8|nr:high affinity immunoglobulin alpha and immunoglobulin mu Fc receptor [Sciurus carolinensis]